MSTMPAPAPAPAPAPPEDEVLSVPRTLGYGLQHVLAMFAGVVTVPIVIGTAAGLESTVQALLVSSALFVSGLATVLQSVGVKFFGAQLPVVQGTSFATVSTLTMIVQGKGQQGMATALGASLVTGVIGLLIVPVFSKIIRYFPPVVTGTIMTTIGLSLLPAAGNWMLGPRTIRDASGAKIDNPHYADPGAIILAMGVLTLVLLLNRIRAVARASVLLGLVVGTLVALPLGMANPFRPGGQDGKLSVGDFISVPDPLHFGLSFDVGAIAAMVVVIMVIQVETAADILAIGEIIGVRSSIRRVGHGLRADMLSSALAPLVNSFPVSAFAQNVGLVAMTRVRSRWVVAAAGGILAALGLSPILSAVIQVVPGSVLGGVGVVLFGTVAASGVRTLSRVSYGGNHNLLIVAVSLSFGLLPKVSPDIWSRFPNWFEVIFGSGITAAAIVAVVLNIALNLVRLPRS